MKSDIPASAVSRELNVLVNDVLGDLAFMITDASQSDPPADITWLAGQVRYRGPVSGTLHCWCTRPFGAQLAGNLLGLDPTADDAQAAAEDALRELLNVLCGQLVTRWFGVEAVFNLSIPSVEVALEPPPGAAQEGARRYYVTIDGEPLVVVHQPD